ncbi:MAG TPA: DUF3341 domain-containing protein [Crocinitomicaceae bacterium]|nr:DUF3341 domain-containing protein [Crocinitomicaceae bacterium]
MADKIIYAMYDDDDRLVRAAKKVVTKGIHVNEVFSPMPIHGIDDVIGVKHTRLGIASFLYGLTGLVLAIWGIKYFNIEDWPMNIGGKPSFSFLENMPAFVPVMFEFTVLCAAHGMALTYMLRNKTLPGMPAENPDPRTTDDRFVMEIRTSENGKFSAEEISSLLQSTEIVELDEKTVK